MTSGEAHRVIIIGGGAAGYFAAITCAEQNQKSEIILLEATDQPLDKVRISGGGRCNVTHSCFDPAELVKAYPRGSRELLGAFSRFQPRDTVAWFAHHGVVLKTEPDGRIFPENDRSSTIVDCLIDAAAALNVTTHLRSRVRSVRRSADSASRPDFELELRDGTLFRADKLLISTGNSQDGYRLAREFGHSIVPCVPSLFTFKISDPRFERLSGVSVERVQVRLLAGSAKFEQDGALLITHWGLSGPVVLKLSAFAARALADADYQASLRINWLPDTPEDSVRELLATRKRVHGTRLARADGIEPIPRRLWSSLVQYCAISDDTSWATITREKLGNLAHELVGSEFRMTGRGIFKEEFVTCGGVSLKEIDFRRMQSRVCPNLHFAGEILDIDGITGGYNFQSAWTTGWIAGMNLAGASA